MDCKIEHLKTVPSAYPTVCFYHVTYPLRVNVYSVKPDLKLMVECSFTN